MTAFELRISDLSSAVCSSDLVPRPPSPFAAELGAAEARAQAFAPRRSVDARGIGGQMIAQIRQRHALQRRCRRRARLIPAALHHALEPPGGVAPVGHARVLARDPRREPADAVTPGLDAVAT